MPAKHLYTDNIPELKHCYEDFSERKVFDRSGSLSTVFKTAHPELGVFNASKLVLPQLFLLDVQWKTATDLVLHESDPSDSIDMNFVIDGNLKAKFNSSPHELDLITGHHNMKFTPGDKSIHKMSRQNASLFVVALDKNYFSSLLGCDDHWSEMIQKKLANSESFFGADNFLGITPRMRALIHTLKSPDPTPGSKLRAEYMLLELLSLQVDQFRSHYRPAKAYDNMVNASDCNKLYQIKEYIDGHFLEDLSLASLCRIGMLNEFKLKQGFKVLFGTSVIQYVRRLRMEYARTLLRDHHLSVDEVSSLLGYQYPQHFSVAFKKHFGVVPSYRSTSKTIVKLR